MENIVSSILGTILGVWFINLMIDFFFGINIIGYLKVWLDLKLLSKKSKSDEDDED